MNRLRPISLKCALALAIVGALSSCSSVPQSEGVRGALIVVGSGTQQGALNVWRAEWIDDNPGVSVNFSPDGAAVGEEALLAGNTHVATTESPAVETIAKQSTAACGPDGAFSIPTAITPVGVAYNLAGLRGVQLDAPTMAAIYMGTIQTWNDERIQKLNPLLDLPSDPIIPVTSLSQSALNKTSTAYLSAQGTTEWKSSEGLKWPAEVVGKKVDKDSDIPQEVDNNFGTIAFMNLSDIGNRFMTASLSFGNRYIAPKTDSIDVAIAESEISSSPAGVALSLASKTGEGYQLATVSYQAFCSTYKNEALATLVRSWAEFVTSEPAQTKARISAGIYSPSESALVVARTYTSTITSSR